jgi:ribosome-binding ATPase YchF (GTP1/OBG family)
VETELMLADLETIERRNERVAARARIGDAGARAELVVLRAAADHLGRGEPARSLPNDVRVRMRDLRLLTDKPVAYVVNTAEGAANGDVDAVAAHARRTGCAVIPASLRVEAELLALPEDEARAYREDAGLGEDVVRRVARAAYELLDLVTFFSTESREVRAWPVSQGTTAQRAAGEIHTDMERGFVRADVVAFDDLVRARSLPAAREQGKVRLEGRDYRIRDGDVVTFRFTR